MYEGKKETERERMENRIKSGKWQTERKRKGGKKNKTT
jgi:hypothetical protein